MTINGAVNISLCVYPFVCAKRRKLTRRAKCLTCGAEVIFNSHRPKKNTKEKIQDKRKEKCFWSYSAMPYVI
jgi:formate dehydrogenase assembly factor FdhD